MKKDINWEEIQEFYNNNGTCRKIAEKFGISSATIQKASKDGRLKLRSPSEAGKLSQKLNPRKLSEETKKKISKSRKAYLKANPDKVPYLLNHYSKGESYPEKYFKKCFENTCLISKHRILNYELDFADIENKIDIEIDGEQHFVDERIRKHDLLRNKTLIELGWKIIRIRWSEFVKLKKEKKEEIVKSIINYKQPEDDCCIIINGKENPLLIMEYNKKEKNKKRISVCPSCKGEKNRAAILCQKCRSLKNRTIPRPSKKILEKEIWEMPMTKIGKKYNTSDNNIRKWCKDYNIELPKRPQGYWSKKHFLNKIPNNETLQSMLNENSMQSIATQLKISVKYLSKHIKEQNLKPLTLSQIMYKYHKEKKK